MEKKLCKSRDRRLFGVCGGLAEYFNLDPSLVRIGVVLFCFAGGTGILAYLVAAFVMPDCE